MTASTDLVRQVQRVARELGKAATWHGTLLPVDAMRDDFVYELMCYFRIALDANSPFVIAITGKIETRRGKKTALWPKKPASKANYSFMTLTSISGLVLQLVPGVKTTDKFGSSRAPDIALLTGGAGAAPTWNDLLGCWEAKYTCRAGVRLPDMAVSDFCFVLDALGSPALPAEWKKCVSAPFRGSGLLTNANQSLESDAALMAHGVLETSRFPKAPLVRP